MKNPITYLERLSKRSYKKSKQNCKALVSPFLEKLLSSEGEKHLRTLSMAAHLSIVKKHPLDLDKAVQLVAKETGISSDVIASIADFYVEKINMGIDNAIKKPTPRGYL